MHLLYSYFDYLHGIIAENIHYLYGDFIPFAFFVFIFPKLSLRNEDLSKTQNYHPGQRKSSRFPPKRYENQEKKPGKAG